MFQFSWPRSNGNSTAGMDIEMGYGGDVQSVCPTSLMLFADWSRHKTLPSSTYSERVIETRPFENTPPATNAIVQRGDSYTRSAPVVFPAQISTAGDPSQQVINSASQEMSLVLVKRNPQPPSRRRRSKSPPIEKVAAAQKVRLVTQEDPRREEEFALMKKNVTYWFPIIDSQLKNTRSLGKAK